MKTYFKSNSIFWLLLMGIITLISFTRAYALTGTRDLEAYTQQQTDAWTDIILKNNDNLDADDPLLDHIKGQWVKDAAEQGYQFAEGGRVNIGDGKLYSFQEPGGVSTDLLDPSVYVMERAETTRNDISAQLEAKYHLSQGYNENSAMATLVVDGEEITQTIGEWFKTESFLTEFRYATGPQSISKKDKQAAKRQRNLEAHDNQLSQGFSIPSYNATAISTNVSIDIPSSDSESSFVASNDIIVNTDSISNDNSKNNVLTTVQLVNKCMARCLAAKNTKTYCAKECNEARCGCRDTDGNGVLETVCEASQFGKKCSGVMSCDVRICDNADLLKQSVWTAATTNNNTQSSSPTALAPDTTINVSAYQGTCPPELCSSTFYPGGLLSGFKCPGTQYCNKYWCKGNCLSSCDTGGNDPYGMCPDAGTVCCKPAAVGNSSPTLTQMAVDSCPSTYCKPVCDSLRENDTGHKSCNGFECCMPNYNLGNCSSLGGECVGGCEGNKILGRDTTLCLQGGICCQKGTGSNLVSYCGCENGQPKCGSQIPNGLQCSTDSQCAGLLNCN